MGLFDLFTTDAKQGKGNKTAAEKLDREQARMMLMQAQVDIDAKQMRAKQDSRIAIKACRAAIANNNTVELQIAKTRLRAHYAMYLYAGSLLNNLKILSANLEMQDITMAFSNVVSSMTNLKIPEGKVDFNKLTRKALKTLAPVDLQGADTMLRTIIEGSLNASDMMSSSAISDDFLDKLIKDDSMLEHETYAGVTNALMQTSAAAQDAVQQAAIPTAQTAATSSLSFDELLQKLSEGLDD